MAKRNKSYRISGHVIDRTTRQGVSGLRIEAWDKDLIFDDLVGSATTDEQGDFQIEFTQSYFRELFLDRQPDLFFKVFRVEELIKSTENSVLWNVEARDTEVVIEVDLPAAGKTEAFVVRGEVRDADGSLLASVVVKAFDKDLRSEQLLGEVMTNKAGRYEIRYSAEQFRRAEKGSADLRVAVVNEDGRELVSSDVIFNASDNKTVDLTLPGKSLSEFETLLRELEPVLQGVPLRELTEEDITFLANDTGIERQRILWLREGAKLEDAAKFVDPDIHTHVAYRIIPTAVFYGWSRQGLPLDRNELLNHPSNTLIAALKKSVEDNIVPANLTEHLDQIRNTLDHVRAGNLLTPAPEGAYVSFGDALQMLAAEEALSPDQARKFALFQADNTPGEDLWEKTADIGLSALQVAGLQRLFALNRIVAGDPALLREANSRLQRESSNQKVPPLLNVAAMDTDDWRSILKAARSSDTDDSTLASQARELTLRVAELMPNDFLLVRAARQPQADLLDARLGQFAKLQELNGREILGKSFEELKTEGIPADERDTMRMAFRDLQRMANYYPGLEMQEILGNDGAAAEKIAEITKRVSLVGKLFTLNPETNFLALDYLPDSADMKALKFDGFEEPDRRMVLRTVKAYQRVYHVAGNALRAKEVLEAGFHSGTAIASLTLDAFAQSTGLTLEEAHPIHEAAKDRALDAGLQFMALYDFLQPLGKGDKHPISSVSASVDVGSYLRRLEGFEEMFGRQATCKCRHCQSVLSAAAYFVDLMRFIDENVTKRIFIGANANHPLELRNRRPDLWSLDLSCENTNTLVPYLDIINEILEAFVAKDLTSRPTERAAIQKGVYRKLAIAQDSFEQPFVLPLRRIEAYLSHFDRIRADVACVLGVDEKTYARVRLGLSLTEWALLITQTQDTTFLTGLYSAAITGNLTPAKEVNVQDLLKLTRWTREDLGQLFDTQFVRADSTITIRARKSGLDSIQNDIEVANGLSFGVLDRLHRFTRLWHKLPWTAPELDLVLVALKTGTDPSLGETELSQIAKLLEIQARFAISVEQLCALFTTIPTTALGNQPPLFDRLFNLEPFVSQDGKWPTGPTPQQFTHPSKGGGTSQPDNKALQRLLAGLQVSDQELVQLIEGLVLTQPFALTIDNLTLLYRHARLSRLLQVSIPELFQLIKLGTNGLTGSHCVGNWTDLSALLEILDKWKVSAFSLDDLCFMTGGPVLKPATYPDAAAVADDIAKSVRADRALEFADTVFSQLPNITEAQSKAIINTNATVFESVSTAMELRLKKSFDPQSGTLTTPAGVTLDLQAARALLDKFHPGGILPSRIASRLRISEEKLRALSTLVGDILDNHDTDLVAELQANGQTPTLKAIVQKFLPLAVLFRSAAWDKTSIEFVKDNPGIFSLALPVGSGLVGVDAAFKVAAYAGWAIVADTEFTPEKAQPDAEAVRKVLKDGFGDNGPLAKALRVPTTQIAALKSHITLDASKPFETLERLGDCLTLSNYLGVSGETLKLIVPAAANASAEYDALTQAAEGLYGVIRAKYPEEKTFLEKIEAYEDKIRGLKRDGLVEYLIRSAKKGFTSPSDLYQYFLIDTQLEGCARTSRVVAANSSLQLYVHRILMNLEQSSDKDPSPVHVKPSLIPPEWAWRKNYRVWEANRKVFLYPENYLEPELRDDKTPLFTDLESTLLEQQINEQNVTAAYSKYLTGYDEVTRLRIAGAFHDLDRVGETDVLHLFGATVDEPPVYYYRTIRNTHYSELRRDRRMSWSPWQKINVQIPVRKASPVVFQGTLFIFWWSKTTTPVTSFNGGSSVFTGYKHKVSLSYSFLRTDGTFSTPQTILCDPENLPFDEPNVVTDLITNQSLQKLPRHRPIDDPPQQHTEPRDSYSLSGIWWDSPVVTAHDGDLVLVIGNNSKKIMASLDLVARRSAKFTGYVNWSGFSRCFHVLNPAEVASGTATWPGGPYFLIPFAMSTTLVSRKAIRDMTRDETTGTPNSSLENNVVAWFKPVSVATLNQAGSIQVIPTNGSSENAILQTDSDLFFLQGAGKQSPASVIRRLSTRLLPSLQSVVSTGGFGALLDTTFQARLSEANPLIPTRQDVVRRDSGSGIDFSGPCGSYLRELFFHIPFLIANHLNSQQRFSASQRWYHYIFDPTSPDTDRDRVWRYRELRGRTPETLRQMLTDDGALEAYRRDPFNPHAIARLRLSAYQKAIVMKYIDNLLDWGDTLFAEFTMESVNEAMMLYVMAADILGPRPPEVGDCGEGDIQPKTYEKIEPLLKETSDFLIEMEHLPTSKLSLEKVVKQFTWIGQQPATVAYAVRSSVMAAGAEAPSQPSEGLFQPYPMGETSTSYWRTTGGIDLKNVSSYGAGIEIRDRAPRNPGLDDGLGGPRISVQRDPICPPNPGIPGVGGNIPLPGGLVPFDYRVPDKFVKEPGLQDPNKPVHGGRKLPPIQLASEVARSSPLFCIPQNADLLAYWDRVEDRLFKIRNCMDITGARRQPSLFAPAIDPRLLVRAKAAGLSLEDVLNVTNGNLPPYRFIFLVDKAKQAASTVQNLGAALLSALEKKDAEELNRLRTVHEQNILKLRIRVQEWEIKVAEDTLDSLERQRETVEYRKNYYEALHQSGLSDWERTQQILQHSANALAALSAILSGAGGVLALVPQVGAPTAMVYGGIQVGKSAEFWAAVSRDTAHLLQLGASSAGLEATFQRRDEEWKHQQTLADKELENLKKQIEAANIRIEIARRSLEIHDKTIEQAEEIFEFYRDKLSNLGLYTWLSTQMHRLYREAFNAAFAMAKMTEQAYLFERPYDEATLLSNNHWEASQAGLLAGERLHLDLQNLERRFLETNYRTLEVEQAFSLTQFDPAALVKLQQTGECDFSIPEIFFDLTYPGHYRRRIKAARLTIPCVTGPYTSVGATLRLTKSWLRAEPKTGSGLTEVPLRHTTAIATSTAQNDAGVFEFSFRDERYMPFEGAGAISDWKLILPQNFRPFDYQTISDVIVRISYTADEDGILRDKVQQLNGTLENNIQYYLSNTGVLRIFSLRREFPDLWHKLVRGPVGTSVEVELTERYVPFFYLGRNLKTTDVDILLQTNLTPTTELQFDATTLSPPATSPSPTQWVSEGDGLYKATVSNVTVLGRHTVKITSSGNLGSASTGTTAAIDESKLTDILLRVKLLVQVGH